MIVAVEGKLEARVPEGAVVQVGGVSLLVQTPVSTLGRFGAEGSIIRLYTHLHVREDAISLFGFTSPDELRAFQHLITVSGVGPKLALGILSNLSPDALRAAISAGNVDMLTSVSGIGKRTAGRLVVELRGKLGSAPSEGAVVPVAESSELIGALTNLGYTAGQVQLALRSLPADPSLSLEDKIVLALRSLAPQ